MKKKEVIFHSRSRTKTVYFAGILVLAGILWLGFQIAGKRSHNTIRITVDGKEFGTYSLSQDQVIHIGDTNVCEIKDGKVTMTEATCPDHYCMKQKAVDEHGGSICGGFRLGEFTENRCGDVNARTAYHLKTLAFTSDTVAYGRIYL